MVDSNGRWQPPNESSNDDDPDKDFPIRQVFTDCSGQTRHFVITYYPLRLGFGVHAAEEGKDGQGYFFREFDAVSPYLALGRVRGRIETAVVVIGRGNHAPVARRTSDCHPTTQSFVMHKNPVRERVAVWLQATSRRKCLEFLREFNLSIEEALDISDHLPVWAEFSIYEGGTRGQVARLN